MSISYSVGENPPKFDGRTYISRRPLNDEGRATSFRSTEITEALKHEEAIGRLMWAELTIEIDNVVLNFWLPSELRLCCQVFDMTPFPTAKTIRASGHVRRANRPNTRLLLTKYHARKRTCKKGAIHTGQRVSSLHLRQ